MILIQLLVEYLRRDTLVVTAITTKVLGVVVADLWPTTSEVTRGL